MTTTEQWTQWENEVINGFYPLRRAVNCSDHSAVFLTEHPSLNPGNALLKLVPAIPTLRQTQLAYWATAATLGHPHLIPLLEAGGCQIKGLQFLFVVMEYAEQTLARLLAQRSLAPAALQEVLRPILSSLAFLHRQQLVHGALKPSNILFVNRQLKLASDTVRPIGESTASIARASVYDPPESRDGSFTSAGDVWSLGVIMVEALTQRQLSSADLRSGTPVLPDGLPTGFARLVQQCLHCDPTRRPTIAELEAGFNPEVRPTPPVLSAVPEYPILSPPEPEPFTQIALQIAGELQNAGQDATSAGRQRLDRTRRPFWIPLRAAVLGLSAVASVVVWASLRMPTSQQAIVARPLVASGSPALARTGTNLAVAPNDAGPDQTEASAQPASDIEHIETVDSPASVLHQESPNVPAGALKTVRGHIKFAVRVRVDSGGNVVHASLASHSPSPYFTRVALDTARKWRFVAADGQLARHWMLWFEFTRDSATTHANASELRQARGG